MLGLILLVFSFVCFTIATFFGEVVGRFSLVAAGLAFLAAYFLFSGASAAHLFH